MPHECAAVGRAELQTKGTLFSFLTFPKDGSRRKLHPWIFDLEIFDTHTYMNFLLRVSVTHRPALAGLIFGRRKERSLRMKSPSLPILQGIYPDRPKESEIHFDTLAPSAKIKIEKRRKTSFTRNSPEKEREINKSGRCTHKSSARMSS